MTATTAPARARVRARARARTPVVFDMRALPRPVVAQWDDLAARVGGASYFRTGTWTESWWSSIASRPRTLVACWHDESGELCAVAAVSHGTETLHGHVPVGVPVVRYAGSGPGDADHCGPVVAGGIPGLHDDVTRWLGRASTHRPFVAAAVAPGGLVPPGAVAVDRTPCPRLVLDGAVPRPGRSSNFRAQLGRYARRLERDGVTFEWLPPGRVDPATTDALLTLHARCRRERGLGTSLDDRHRRLLLACASATSSVCGPAALVARARDRRAVGVLLGFRFQDWFGAYQSGWDERYAEHSIGSVLVAQAITAAATEGVGTFDFLRGDEAYKYRFGATDAYDTTFVVPRGAAGRVLLARAALMEWRRSRRR